MFSQVSVCPQGGDVHPLGGHPAWVDIPWADTPLGQTPPLFEMASAADGTHPTGMHSCNAVFIDELAK